MLSALMVTLFTVIRIVIPAVILLSLGEIVRRHNQNLGNLRGA